MLAGIRKRLARKHCDSKDGDEDDKDDSHSFSPPTNYIKISQGKIQLVQSRSLESEANDGHSEKNKEVLENRIVELEGALLRLQEKVNNSPCTSPTFEKELRDQLEGMNRVMKSKERKQMQTCRDHKALQTRFARQEALLHAMQQENKALILRIRQYEHCLDDVMRKVVDAIVAEDNLREEVAMLKSRVRDLEAQNAALSASPAKGRDEGYCTMSSGQPQPSNGHLEDLPEEPEQWLLPAEPCSTEMEDWSMSQEELAVITLDEEREQLQQMQHQQQQQQQDFRSQVLQQHHQQQQQRHNGESDWLWNSQDFLNSTESDAVTDGITQLLQQKIVYSEDEEVACTEFTNDFYKLVNIRPSSQRSLYSYLEADTDEEDDEDEDDEDDDDDDVELELQEGDSSVSGIGGGGGRVRLRKRSTADKRTSPTPSEAGRAQVTSCSSSESDELSRCTATHQQEFEDLNGLPVVAEQAENHTKTERGNAIKIAEQLKAIAEKLPKCLNGGDLDVGGHHTDSDIDLEIEMEEEIVIELDSERAATLSEKQCIEEIIKSELRRPPPPPLIKSKSTLDEDEPICILRNNQRREIESSVVRSGSVNCAFAAAAAAAAAQVAASPAKLKSCGKLQERLLQRPMNSWRKSNGWKRVTSPVQTPTALISPKKEIRSEIAKIASATQKVHPTRIPTCIPHLQPAVFTAKQAQLQQHQQQLQSQPTTPQPIRKSKIPPPVPVRRSYAS